MREFFFLCHLFIEKNDPVLHICVLQKYVNLCFQYLVWPLLLQQLKVKLLVNADQSFTITCRSFRPFLSAEPLKLCEIGGFPPMHCLLESFHNILIGLRSGLWLSYSKTLTLFFFNHSLVELLVCLGLLSCCMTHVLMRLLKFIVPSMMAGSPGQDAAKQAQAMILPPTCLKMG